MQFLNWCIGGAALLTVSASAMAALPAPGLWAMNDEVNGKPGRGIQIDRQGGETIIVSYYGYRVDGTAVFYQAVAKVTDGKTFNANLIEYKGGTVIDGAVKGATEAKVIGPIQAIFSTDTSGSVTLPGLESKAFSRYIYEDHRQRLNNTFAVLRVYYTVNLTQITNSRLTFQIDGNRLKAFYSREHEREICEFNGDIAPDGEGFSSTGVFTCEDGIATPAHNISLFKSLKVSEKGILTGILWSGPSLDRLNEKTTLTGTCISPVEDVISDHTPGIYECSPPQLGLTSKPE